ncbi:MAG TPA: hypothetical protein VH475_04435 [Tepidisphaeraceae bacterium]|jgi:hypothetical protein
MTTLSGLAQTALARAAAATPTNTYPGVYVTEQPAATKPIPGVETGQVLRNTTAAADLHVGDALNFVGHSPAADAIARFGDAAVKVGSSFQQSPITSAASRFGVGSIIGKVKLAPTFDGPPILGTFQQQRFADNFAKLNVFDQARFGLLLVQAGSDHERQYLQKALAAGHTVDEVSTFADEIRGKSDAWMQQNLRLTGNANGAAGLSQQWNDSCGPATAQVLRGEMDPIYSLSMRQGDTDIHAVDPRPNATYIDQIVGIITGHPVGDHKLAAEEKSILENGGGVAVERGQAGGAGMNFAQAFNSMTQWTGVTYIRHNVTTDTGRKDALAKLDADLAAGIPGALRISSDDTNSGGHAVAVTGSIDGPPKQYVLHDPWDGKTVYVKASDLQAGNIIPTIAGWTHLTDVYSST